MIAGFRMKIVIPESFELWVNIYTDGPKPPSLKS